MPALYAIDYGSDELDRYARLCCQLPNLSGIASFEAVGGPCVVLRRLYDPESSAVLDQKVVTDNPIDIEGGFYHTVELRKLDGTVVTAPLSELRAPSEIVRAQRRPTISMGYDRL